MVHGFAEHSGRYGHVASALVSCGVNVTALDLRGHGASGGTRAFIRRFDDYLDDLDAVLESETSAGSGHPLLLMGHSMGGLVTALHTIERRRDCAGLILSSPCFGFALKVPAWKAAAGQVFSRLVPRLSLPSGLDRALLSHDPEVQRKLEHDPHSLVTATARWYTETIAAQGRALERANELSLPLLCQVAGDDRLVEAGRSREFFESAGSSDKQWRCYDGLYHEIYNELERDRVLDDLTGWVRAQIGAAAPRSHG